MEISPSESTEDFAVKLSRSQSEKGTYHIGVQRRPRRSKNPGEGVGVGVGRWGGGG